MSYIIIGDLFTFPQGEAATNRVHSYGKGLVSNGKNVHVICFGNDYTEYMDGEVDGIRYYHPFGQKKKSKRFIVRNWKKVKKYFRTFMLVRRLNRQEKVSSIIVYSGLPGTFLFAWLMTRIIGSRLLQEVSEHPLRYYQSGTIRKKMGFLKLNVESALTDGILCISHFLIDFYKERGFPERRLILIPSTADPYRFNIRTDRPLPYQYIGYFGGLTFQRDNVDLLVKAYARIADKFPELHLVMGGPVHGNEKNKIAELATELGIREKLNLLEYMPREEIINYIVNSEILVMVRANDLKAQASFPSKLTEYLATGKPVISVNVGEISDYLTDGINAYLVDPGDEKTMADKMDLILTCYDSALETAMRGRQLVYNVFNYSHQAKRIIIFTESLYKA